MSVVPFPQPEYRFCYTEGDYLAYCAERPTATGAELVAWFGSRAAEQMEARFQMEHCAKCDEEVSEDEANEADRDSRDPICESCRCEVLFGHPRDNPDADNDTPRSELE